MKAPPYSPSSSPSSALLRPPDLGALFLTSLVAGLDPVMAIRPQALDQRLGHRQIVEPLMVGRRHVPGRVRAAAGVDRRLIGGHVVVPELTLLPIPRGDLPGRLQIGFALLEPSALLPLADVEEDLHHDDAVLMQQPLEVVDVGEAKADVVLWRLIVHLGQ